MAKWRWHPGHPLPRCFPPPTILSPRTKETSWMLFVLPWWQQRLNLSPFVQQRKVGAVCPIFCWDSGTATSPEHTWGIPMPGEVTQTGRNREGQEGKPTPLRWEGGSENHQRCFCYGLAASRRDPLPEWFQHSQLHRSLSPNPCS